MEFKLNKIDMDIRHRLKEENSDKKVLNSKDINPSKDTIQKKNDFKNNSKKKSNNNSKKQKRTAGCFFQPTCMANARHFDFLCPENQNVLRQTG